MTELADGEICELMEQVRRIATCSTFTSTSEWQNELQRMAGEMWSYYVTHHPRPYGMSWHAIREETD